MMHTRQKECFCIVCPHHYLAAKQTGEHITHYILALHFVEENVKRKCDYFLVQAQIAAKSAGWIDGFPCCKGNGFMSLQPNYFGRKMLDSFIPPL